MYGSSIFDGPAEAAIAVGVTLSAIVSLIGVSMKHRNVVNGRAKTQDLCELTGITDPRWLQDIFGPPDMGMIWKHVTMEEIYAARRPIGHLMSNPIVDYCCIVVAIFGMITSYGLVDRLIDLGLFIALVIQVTSWIIALRLPK